MTTMPTERTLAKDGDDASGTCSILPSFLERFVGGATTVATATMSTGRRRHWYRRRRRRNNVDESDADVTLTATSRPKGSTRRHRRRRTRTSHHLQPSMDDNDESNQKGVTHLKTRQINSEWCAQRTNADVAPSATIQQQQRKRFKGQNETSIYGERKLRMF